MFKWNYTHSTHSSFIHRLTGMVEEQYSLDCYSNDNKFHLNWRFEDASFYSVDCWAVMNAKGFNCYSNECFCLRTQSVLKQFIIFQGFFVFATQSDSIIILPNSLRQVQIRLLSILVSPYLDRPPTGSPLQVKWDYPHVARWSEMFE